MKQAKVTQKLTGVRVAFSGDVAKQSVVSMVERCREGQCDCMSEASKQKIAGMDVHGDDGHVELNLTGDLSVDEVEAALRKSPLLNE